MQFLDPREFDFQTVCSARIDLTLYIFIHLGLALTFSFSLFLFPIFSSSGVVVTMECVEKLIRKDMTDPVTGDKLKEKDIIPLQRVCMRDIML